MLDPEKSDAEEANSPKRKKTLHARARPCVENETDQVREEVARQHDAREVERIKGKLSSGSETDENLFHKIIYALDDPVLRTYIERVKNASSSKNTKPVSLYSEVGRKTLAMIDECEDLFKCLEGSNLHFSIDGAIGLSLRQLSKTQSFLRQHRDIDILVPEDELADMSEMLARPATGHKWGLFIWHTQDANKGVGMSFSPFEPDQFQGNEMLVAMPINDNGSPDTKRYDALTMIDIHYLKKDGENYRYNRLLVKPESLFGSEIVSLPKGTTSPVVGLVHMAIGKAKSDRSQDNYDLAYILKDTSNDQKEMMRAELKTLLERTDNLDERGHIERAIEKIV